MLSSTATIRLPVIAQHIFRKICTRPRPYEVFSGPAHNTSKSSAGHHQLLDTPPTTKMSKFSGNKLQVEDLTKRRFFYRQASDIYGGAAGFFAYGPPGCAMKNNLFSIWRQHFVVEENLMEIEDTIIMQERVLKASGHVDKFDDFIVKDSKDESKFWRADKLLEEELEKRIAECKDDALKHEMQVALNGADGFDADELVETFEKFKIVSPDSGAPLTRPISFNLMFPTNIGPVAGDKGFLRPETAQGIFLNYKFCKEQNSERMPFGIAQIGKVFRNEIAPRAGLTRMREFQQMEIEWFIKPNEYDHPKWNDVKDLEITLWSGVNQEKGAPPTKQTLQEALDTDILRHKNETMGYMIGRTFEFLVKAGCDPNHIRFRQHMAKEMAHYACECWDAEAETSYGWLEIVGIANRSAFDLTAHSKATGVDLQIRETLKEPIEVEETKLTKDAAKEIMKALKKDGKPVKEALESMSFEELRELQKQADAGTNPKVQIGANTFEIPAAKFKTATKTVKQGTIAYIPSVIEPSFGVDRIMYTIFEHTYKERPSEGDNQTRAFLNLPVLIAPYKYVLLPVDQRITRDERYPEIVKTLKKEFTRLNINGTVDESSQTIGKRYARNDEVGVPFAVTIDNDCLLNNVATLRERNSVRQIVVPLADIPLLVEKMFSGVFNWDDALAKYKEQANAATAAVGVATTAAPAAAWAA